MRIERNVPLTACSTCACLIHTQEPKERDSGGWRSVPRVSAGICCVGTGHCLSLARSLPRGLVTSPRRQQQCRQWEEAATGGLQCHGVGGAPGPLLCPRKAAKLRAWDILWWPSQLNPEPRRDAAPRLTSGGHRQSCRLAAPGPRGVTALPGWGEAGAPPSPCPRPHSL